MPKNDDKKACRKRSTAKHPCSVTMPRKLQEAVIQKANAEDRSFSATVRRALEIYIAANNG